MKNYQYILLDWDGNLVKTLDLWLEACRVPLVKRGLHLTDEEIADSFGAFGQYIKKWGLTDTDAIFEEADEIAKQLLPNVELYPDTLEVLGELKVRGKKLALITTSIRENIQYVLGQYNMSGYFDVIVAGDDVKNHKPHAEPLERAINILGGTKEQSIMIGDSDKDLGASANAGIDSVLFYPPEHRKFYDLDKLQEYKPTYVIDDFRKLLQIIGD
ncbi:HAD-IA family hydrolase [Candidatus Saccharibacteria bacterium]|nr:HAD-IA family hydrolase [Candidatus Saccharibacteria bacterium]